MLGATLVVWLGPSVLLPVYALDYTYSPHAASRMRVDDNIRGQSRNPQDAWGFDISGGVELLARSATFKSELNPRALVRRFVVGDNLDTEEYYVDFNNEWMRERLIGNLDFSYERSSTLTNEITEDGLINDVKDRDAVELTPSLSWTLSERWVGQASFYFTDVSYLDAEDTGLTDYNYMQAGTGATYTWNETTQFFGNVFVSQFKTPDLEGRTRSYGAQLGASKQLDPTLMVSASAGYLTSDIEFVNVQRLIVVDPIPRFIVVRSPDESSSSGPLATVNIVKEFLSTTATFDYARQVSPSGRGSQTVTDEISLRLVRRISDYFSLVFSGRHQIRSAEGDGLINGLDRDLSVVQGSASYRLTESWTLGASYRFMHRSAERPAGTFNADSNTIFVTLSFNGLAQSIPGF